MSRFDRLWERHKNPWSWAVRPLLGVLYLYGAWARSVPLMAAALAGLATSWFWFPKPARPHPSLDRFIEIERRYVTRPYTAGKIAGGVAVLVFLVAVTVALWTHNLRLGLGVFAAGAAGKAVWSLKVAGRAGLPAAAIGAASALLAGLAAYLLAN